jgi:hypothetical protein
MKIHTMTCIGDIGEFHNGFGDADAEEAKGPETALRSQTEAGKFPEYYCVPILSPYKLLSTPDVKWVIMSTVDEAKALVPNICVSKRGI